jgi:hypothetical protein
LNHSPPAAFTSVRGYGFHRHVRGALEEHFSVKMRKAKNRHLQPKNAFLIARETRLSARSTAHQTAVRRRKPMRFWCAQQPLASGESQADSRARQVQYPRERRMLK